MTAYPPTPPTEHIPIIGIHHSALSQKFGVPRQPSLVSVPTYIEMLPPYNTPDAFVGIEAFSHLWIVWQFHQNQPQASFRPQVRPPRLGGNDKLGVFATRSMYRPSGLGLSVVRLTQLEVIKSNAGKQGVRLHMTGADMIDATPIIDIKPYVAYSDSISNAQCGFATSKPISKQVESSPQAKHSLQTLVTLGVINADDIGYIHELIAQDPRPAYRQSELHRQFVMRYKDVDISFMMVACQNNPADTKLLILDAILCDS